MKRWIWILILIVVLIGGFFGFRAYRASQLRGALEDLQTVEASTGSLTGTVGATGTVRANQATILTFQTSGTVESVSIGMGDQVIVGDELARLKETSLSAQVIMAQADLVTAQRALDDLLYSVQASAMAQRALAQAQDALDDANYIRTVRQEGNRASQATLDATRADLILAERDVEQAQAMFDRVAGRPEDDPTRAFALSNLSAARQRRDSIQRNLNWYIGQPSETEQALLDADVALAEAQLTDALREWERVKDGPDPMDVAAAEARVAAAQATVELASVKAPFEGTITSVEVKPGGQVNPGTVAVGLADLSRLLVDVDISEVDINRVQVGQPVILNFDAVVDREFQGEVVEIGITGVVVQGVVNFKVTVELIDPDEAIKPGMTAAVNIIVSEIENVLLVPNRAVRLLDGERVVYVLEQGELEPVRIELGISSDTHSEVIGGELRDGDLIVLNPPSFLFEHGQGPGFFGR
ncbi:MAG: efflux RND transporter periplasmic adaptor subunit [Anaerolineaceae bacterium]|nr:MAG: efflux RND transporter periplasmic adaptor subunit [Anaerolineaceae bacterium]